jgi:hypothetical protein
MPFRQKFIVYRSVTASKVGRKKPQKGRRKKEESSLLCQGFGRPSEAKDREVRGKN